MKNTAHGKHLIHKKLNMLASQLSKALAPLLFSGLNTSREHNLDFHTWGEEATVWKDRKDCFTRIFELALELKTMTVTTNFQYEFVIYLPGASHIEEPTKKMFDGRSMQQRIAESKFWLHACMYMYKVQSLEQQGSLAQALVQCRNFIKISPDERIGYCIAKSSCCRKV